MKTINLVILDSAISVTEHSYEEIDKNNSRNHDPADEKRY